ncbi:MAG: hypothetical protein AMXMBFR84_44070 [Candidatus Hydrogenedentota bacterium]
MVYCEEETLRSRGVAESGNLATTVGKRAGNSATADFHNGALPHQAVGIEGGYLDSKHKNQILDDSRCRRVGCYYGHGGFGGSHRRTAFRDHGS